MIKLNLTKLTNTENKVNRTNNACPRPQEKLASDTVSFGHAMNPMKPSSSIIRDLKILWARATDGTLKDIHRKGLLRVRRFRNGRVIESNFYKESQGSQVGTMVRSVCRQGNTSVIKSINNNGLSVTKSYHKDGSAITIIDKILNRIDPKTGEKIPFQHLRKTMSPEGTKIETYTYKRTKSDIGKTGEKSKFEERVDRYLSEEKFIANDGTISIKKYAEHGKCISSEEISSNGTKVNKLI